MIELWRLWPPHCRHCCYVSVIDGIAFQPKNLALSAPVEAARAGEQRRGIAVIASEVRSLAHRSSGAAKQINELIRDPVETVESGGDLVRQVSDTMNLTVYSIQDVATIISENSVASSDQNCSIVEVNQATRQIDDMTQQNAAVVEQAAAAGKSLEEQAELLKQVVNVFKLNEADSPAFQELVIDSKRMHVPRLKG